MHCAISVLICVAACAAQTLTPTEQDPGVGKFLGQEVVPVDQAIGHPGLVSFRSRLIGATLHHDLRYLLSVTDPSVGGCGWQGLDGFRTFVTEPGGWAAIRSALEAGGVMASSVRFRSNYVMVTFPEDADMTAYVVAIKPHVPVYERPDTASKVIVNLHYEIVAPIGTGTQWQEIEYRPGRIGFVRTDNLQPPTGYSVDLALRKGQWQIQWIASYCD